MSKTLSEAHWREDFDIKRDDLQRLAEHIRETGQAHDLTTLARRVVRGRLRHGEDTTEAVLPGITDGTPVRLWDPAGEWKVGDRVIVAVGFAEDGTTHHKPFVGEVSAIAHEEVTVQIDSLAKPKQYHTKAKFSHDDLQKWRRFVAELVKTPSAEEDEETKVDRTIFRHGERIVSRLLQALQADNRFLALDGRWFVRDLTTRLNAAQMRLITATLAQRREPVATADLLSLVLQPLPEGDAGLFSLYAALLARPDRFANVGSPTRPVWQITPVPWKQAVGAFPAYDPETYEILLTPGQPVKKTHAERLQALGLYDALVEPAYEP